MDHGDPDRNLEAELHYIKKKKTPKNQQKPPLKLNPFVSK